MTTTRRRRGGGLLALTVAALAAVTAPMTAVEATETTQNHVSSFHIRGSGTTNPSKLFWWAMDKLGGAGARCALDVSLRRFRYR